MLLCPFNTYLYPISLTEWVCFVRHRNAPSTLILVIRQHPTLLLTISKSVFAFAALEALCLSQIVCLFIIPCERCPCLRHRSLMPNTHNATGTTRPAYCSEISFCFCRIVMLCQHHKVSPFTTFRQLKTPLSSKVRQKGSRAQTHTPRPSIKTVTPSQCTPIRIPTTKAMTLAQHRGKHKAFTRTQDLTSLSTKKCTSAKCPDEHKVCAHTQSSSTKMSTSLQSAGRHEACTHTQSTSMTVSPTVQFTGWHDQ